MTSKKLKIAVAQLNISWEDKLANQRKCQRLVHKAAERGADIIIFPEMTLTGFSMNTFKVAEKEKNSQTVIFFSKLAKEYSIGIIFGVVFWKGKKGKNMAITVNKHGKILMKYQKIHPFRLAKEDKYYEEGKTIKLINYSGFKIALLICYDLRFIGLINSLLKHQPDLLIVIANWPKQRVEHWQALLRARALDLQSYVVGVNRKSEGKRLKYNGQSMAVSPNGKILLDLKEKNLALINLDKDKLKVYRRKFPFLLDSRNKFYSAL